MNIGSEYTLEELRLRARRAGLNLSEQELGALGAGVNRSRKQALELRDMITAHDEPALRFRSLPLRSI